jgi:nucleoside-diphosphate-sugar epimerase
MRVVVIGGTGDIGTYLEPGMVKTGHDTVVISRGSRRAYRDDPAWQDVEMVTCDREAAEHDGRFGTVVAALRPDAVVDLTCFTPEQARQLVDALDGQHVVHTGTNWSYGPSSVVPTTEDAPKHPYGEYGVNKLAVERYLTRERDRVLASVVHPSHIRSWLTTTAMSRGWSSCRGDEFTSRVDSEHAQTTLDHIGRAPL